MRGLRPWRRAAVSVAAILLLLGAIVVTVNGSVSKNKAGATTTVTTKNCATQVHDSSQDAPAGSHQFGAELMVHTVPVGQLRDHIKLCTEPVYTAISERIVVDGDKTVDNPAIQARAQQFLADRNLWRAVVKQIRDRVDTYSVENRSDNYYTMGMVPNPGGLPTVIASTQSRPMGWVLVMHLKEGGVLYWEFRCDLQPASPVPFTVTPSHGPSVMPHQPQVTPPPASHPTTTTQPHTPTTVKCPHALPTLCETRNVNKLPATLHRTDPGHSPGATRGGSNQTKKKQTASDTPNPVTGSKPGPNTPIPPVINPPTATPDPGQQTTPVDPCNGDPNCNGLH